MPEICPIPIQVFENQFMLPRVNLRVSMVIGELVCIERNRKQYLDTFLRLIRSKHNLIARFVESSCDELQRNFLK